MEVFSDGGMNMFEWILLLAGSIAFFIALELLVFPKCFLKGKYTIGQTSDRGLRKYKTSDDGVYFLYEPGWFVRRYIKQYVIAVENEGKSLTCMLEDGVDYARFDVVLFNTADRVFNVLNVQQLVGERAYTDPSPLPPETAYVTLVLNQVNSREFPEVARSRITTGKLIAFGVSTCVTAMVTAFCMNLSFANLFGKVFRETYAAATAQNVAVLAVALVASLIGTTALSVAIALKNQKK